MYLSGRTKTAAYFSKTAFNLFSESSSESISITLMLSKFLIAFAFSDKSKFVSLVKIAKHDDISLSSICFLSFNEMIG